MESQLAARATDAADIDLQFEAPGPGRVVQYSRRRALRWEDVSADAAGRRRDSVRRRLLATADVVALGLAYAAVIRITPLRFGSGSLALLATVLPVWVVLHKALGLYDRDANLIHKSTLDELPRLLESIALGTATLVLLGAVLPGPDMTRTEALAFIAVAAALLPSLRGAGRAFVRRHYAPERCMIVGSGTVASLLARKMEAHSEYGVELVGFLDEDWEHGDAGADVRLLGHARDFERVCRDCAIERVVIAFSTLSHEELLNVMRIGRRLNLKITIVPRLYEAIGHSVELDQIEGMTVMGLRFTRTRSTLLLKRAIDFCGAALGLLVLLPLMTVIAVAVKLTSPGPVLFVQRRIGRDNAAFPMFKFRTMYDGADALKASIAHLNEARYPMFKIDDDPRVTPVGRFLRRTSLDEVPQLFNVLRGEMSLVGPRPLVPDESDQVLGRHRARLELTPGLTGPWQVLGRTAIPFEEMVKLDYLYVAEWSLWNDVKLLVRTAHAVLQRTGA